MTDINDFTDYTEGCSCGHSRSDHGNVGGCSGTRSELDTSKLPPPTIAPEDVESPFAWPNNWPPVDVCPHVNKPCTCRRFSPAEPEPPEDWS